MRIPIRLLHPCCTTLNPCNGTAGDLEGGTGWLLAVREAAERLAVSTATVYALCERGELPHVRVSNAMRITPADLAALLAGPRSGGRS